MIDLRSEVNVIAPAYVKKLGLRLRKTDVGAQKIDRSTLETYSMVIAGFQHREILCRPDLNGGSEILSIYRDPSLAALDPSLGTLDPPLSTFSGLSPALILFRAELWIDDPV